MEQKVLIYLILLHLGIRSVLCQSQRQKKKHDELDSVYNEHTVLAIETSRAELSTKCVPSITEVSGQTFCSGDLIFEDNFDSMNWTKWQREIRIGLKSEDREFVSYLDRLENCLVNDGKLKISTTLKTEIQGFNEKYITNGALDLKSSCTALMEYECYTPARLLPPITSARIRTKGSFEFRYGRVEVRAKLPKGDWLYPQILLEPTDYSYGFDNYASGQMRVAFAYGNDRLICNSQNRGGYCLQGGAFLTRKPLQDIWLRSTCQLRHLGDAFHVYALTWTDSYIALEIDGKEYGRIKGRFEVSPILLPHSPRWKKGEFMAPFDRKFHITLGLAVGGRTEFPDSCINAMHKKRPWENNSQAINGFWNAINDWRNTWDINASTLQVDYVRVYAI